MSSPLTLPSPGALFFSKVTWIWGMLTMLAFRTNLKSTWPTMQALGNTSSNTCSSQLELQKEHESTTGHSIKALKLSGYRRSPSTCQPSKHLFLKLPSSTKFEHIWIPKTWHLKPKLKEKNECTPRDTIPFPDIFCSSLSQELSELNEMITRDLCEQ